MFIGREVSIELKVASNCCWDEGVGGGWGCRSSGNRDAIIVQYLRYLASLVLRNPYYAGAGAERYTWCPGVVTTWNAFIGSDSICGNPVCQAKGRSGFSVSRFCTCGLSRLAWPQSANLHCAVSLLYTRSQPCFILAVSPTYLVFYIAVCLMFYYCILYASHFARTSHLRAST